MHERLGALVRDFELNGCVFDRKVRFFKKVIKKSDGVGSGEFGGNEPLFVGLLELKDGFDGL